jgi:hypothetical protein
MMKLTLLGMILVLGLVGCGGSPVGVDEQHPDFANEKPIGDQDQQRLFKYGLLDPRDGITTRDDVIRIMGQPDRTADHGRVLVYLWMVYRQTGGSANEAVVWHFLISEFDVNGVMVKHGLKNGDSKEGGPDSFDKALESWGIRGTAQPNK